MPPKNQAETAVTADQSSRTSSWSFWAIFGRPWAKIGVGPNLKIGPYSPGGMSSDLCHPRTKLNQPFRPTRAVEPVFGHFGPFWAILGHFWAPELNKSLGTKWHKGHRTQTDWKQVLFQPNLEKNLRPPPLGHCVLVSVSLC